MADEHNRHAGFLPDLVQKIENLRLNGDIKCCGRLIRNQHIRLSSESNGDHDALTLAAGKFMRKEIEPTRGIGNANPFHKPDRFKTGSFALQSPMKGKGFHDLRTNFLDRIERGAWVLKNHRNTTTANTFLNMAWSINKLLTIDTHRTGDRCLARQKAKGCEPGHRFSATGFTNQTQSFTPVYVDIDAVQNLHTAE